MTMGGRVETVKMVQLDALLKEAGQHRVDSEGLGIWTQTQYNEVLGRLRRLSEPLVRELFDMAVELGSHRASESVKLDAKKAAKLWQLLAGILYDKAFPGASTILIERDTLFLETLVAALHFSCFSEDEQCRTHAQECVKLLMFNARYNRHRWVLKAVEKDLILTFYDLQCVREAKVMGCLQTQSEVLVTCWSSLLGQLQSKAALKFCYKAKESRSSLRLTLPMIRILSTVVIITHTEDFSVDWSSLTSLIVDSLVRTISELEAHEEMVTTMMCLSPLLTEAVEVALPTLQSRPNSVEFILKQCLNSLKVFWERSLVHSVDIRTVASVLLQNPGCQTLIRERMIPNHSFNQLIWEILSNPVVTGKRLTRATWEVADCKLTAISQLQLSFISVKKSSKTHKSFKWLLEDSLERIQRQTKKWVKDQSDWQLGDLIDSLHETFFGRASIQLDENPFLQFFRAIEEMKENSDDGDVSGDPVFQFFCVSAASIIVNSLGSGVSEEKVRDKLAKLQQKLCIRARNIAGLIVKNAGGLSGFMLDVIRTQYFSSMSSDIRKNFMSCLNEFLAKTKENMLDLGCQNSTLRIACAVTVYDAKQTDMWKFSGKKAPVFGLRRSSQSDRKHTHDPARQMLTEYMSLPTTSQSGSSSSMASLCRLVNNLCKYQEGLAVVVNEFPTVLDALLFSVVRSYFTLSLDELSAREVDSTSSALVRIYNFISSRCVSILLHFLQCLLASVSSSNVPTSEKNLFAKELLCDGSAALHDGLIDCSSIVIWFILHKFSRALRTHEAASLDTLRQDLNNDEGYHLQELHDHYAEVAPKHPAVWLLDFISSEDSRMKAFTYFRSKDEPADSMLQVIQDLSDLRTLPSIALQRLVNTVIERLQTDCLQVSLNVQDFLPSYCDERWMMKDDIRGLMVNSSVGREHYTDTVSFLRVSLAFLSPLKMPLREKHFHEYYKLLSHQCSVSKDGNGPNNVFSLVINGLCHPSEFSRYYCQVLSQILANFFQFVGSYWDKFCFEALRNNVAGAPEKEQDAALITSEANDTDFEQLWEEGLSHLRKSGLVSGMDKSNPQNCWISLLCEVVRQLTANAGDENYLLFSALPTGLTLAVPADHNGCYNFSHRRHIYSSACLHSATMDILQLLASFVEPFVSLENTESANPPQSPCGLGSFARTSWSDAKIWKARSHFEVFCEPFNAETVDLDVPQIVSAKLRSMWEDSVTESAWLRFVMSNTFQRSPFPSLLCGKAKIRSSVSEASFGSPNDVIYSLLSFRSALRLHVFILDLFNDEIIQAHIKHLRPKSEAFKAPSSFIVENIHVLLPRGIAEAHASESLATVAMELANVSSDSPKWKSQPGPQLVVFGTFRKRCSWSPHVESMSYPSSTEAGKRAVYYALSSRAHALAAHCIMHIVAKHRPPTGGSGSKLWNRLLYFCPEEDSKPKYPVLLAKSFASLLDVLAWQFGNPRPEGLLAAFRIGSIISSEVLKYVQQQHLTSKQAKNLQRILNDIWKENTARTSGNGPEHYSDDTKVRLARLVPLVHLLQLHFMQVFSRVIAQTLSSTSEVPARSSYTVSLKFRTLLALERLLPLLTNSFVQAHMSVFFSALKHAIKERDLSSLACRIAYLLASKLEDDTLRRMFLTFYVSVLPCLEIDDAFDDTRNLALEVLYSRFRKLIPRGFGLNNLETLKQHWAYAFDQNARRLVPKAIRAVFPVLGNQQHVGTMGEEVEIGYASVFLQYPNFFAGIIQCQNMDDIAQRFQQEGVTELQTFNVPQAVHSAEIRKYCATLLDSFSPAEMAKSFYEYLMVDRLGISKDVGECRGIPIIPSKLKDLGVWVTDLETRLKRAPLEERLLQFDTLIQHESSDVVLIGLRELERTLTKRPVELLSLVAGGNEMLVSSVIRDLVTTLLRIAKDSPHSAVRTKCGSCLGEMGAIDPSRIGSLILRELPSKVSPLELLRSALEDYLVKGLRAAQSAKNQRTYGFSVQEVLKALAKAVDLTDASATGRSVKRRKKTGSRISTLEDCFGKSKKLAESSQIPEFISEKLSAESLSVVLPYWTSNYKLNATLDQCKKMMRELSQIYEKGSANTTFDLFDVKFSEYKPSALLYGFLQRHERQRSGHSLKAYDSWLTAWASLMIDVILATYHIQNDIDVETSLLDFDESSCSPLRVVALSWYALRTPVLVDGALRSRVLPQLVHDVLVFCGFPGKNMVSAELMAILETCPTMHRYVEELSSSSNYASEALHQNCVQTLFTLMDCLSFWVKQGTGDSQEDDCFRSQFHSIEALLDKQRMAEAAMAIGAYTRSLRYWDEALRTGHGGKYKSAVSLSKESASSNLPFGGVIVGEVPYSRDELSLMQEITAKIDDPDELSGMASLRSRCIADTYEPVCDDYSGASTTISYRDIREKLVDSEHTAQFTDALSYYEYLVRSTAEASPSVWIHEGLMRNLILTGKPGIALDHACHIMQKNASLRAYVLPHAIEAAWRSEQWNVLKRLILPSKSSNDDKSEKNSPLRNSHKPLETHMGYALLELHDAIEELGKSPESQLTDWVGAHESYSRRSKPTPLATSEDIIRGPLKQIMNSNNRNSRLFAARNALDSARQEAVAAVAASASESYYRCYPALVQLQEIREIEKAIDFTQRKHKSRYAKEEEWHNWHWWERLDSMAPALHVIEPVLAVRRCIAGLHGMKEEQTTSWLKLAKLARHESYHTTARAAVIEASTGDIKASQREFAKLLKSQGQVNEAIAELEPVEINPEHIVEKFHNLESTGKSCSGDRLEAAKRIVSVTNWLVQSRRANEYIKDRYTAAIHLVEGFSSHGQKTKFPKGHFYLAQYYDQLLKEDPRDEYLIGVIVHYSATLKSGGSKYLFQALPRILTLWLDYGAAVAGTGQKKYEFFKFSNANENTLENLTAEVHDLSGKIPAFLWVTVLPQLTSRICHRHRTVYKLLGRILSSLLWAYPKQALWSILGLSYSRVELRKKRAREILKSAQGEITAIKDAGEKSKSKLVTDLIETSKKLFKSLIELAEKKPEGDSISIPEVSSIKFRNGLLLVPTLSALTIRLSLTNKDKNRNSSGTAGDGFPPSENTAFIRNIDTTAQVMPSKEKPKKLTITGSDGRRYAFLCKAEQRGDLRKDARMMEFVTMVNRLMSKDTEGRRRGLRLKTYAVTCLNEECGLIEWVDNTAGLRHMIKPIYKKCGLGDPWSILKTQSNALQQLQANKKITMEEKCQLYQKKVLSKFPAVLHHWFNDTFSDPTQWHQARCTYTRSAACWSIVGHIIGLGDRHADNIMLHSVTGEVVHVDFDCLFDKGLTLPRPEIVPFRLTPNMLDAMGITGYEGSFRNVCEVILSVLRQHRELLISGLESFIHDPLVEWSRQGRRGVASQAAQPSSSFASTANGAEVINQNGQRMIDRIEDRLRGKYNQGKDFIPYALPVSHHNAARELNRNQPELSVQGQVDKLLKEATAISNLLEMFVGWMPCL